MFKKILNKTISVVLIILLNYLAFFAFDLKPAFAYFDDQEMITDNTMSAGTLDLSTNSIADFSPQVTPSQTATRAIDIQNNGSLLLQTNVTDANFFDSGSNLCANLNLEVLAGATTIYNGSLIGLSSAPILVPTSTTQTLNFTATLTNNDLGLQNKTCNFDLITNGWQDNIVSYGAGGFFDQEILPSAISSGTWSITPPTPIPQPGDVVINEVMWMGSQDIDNPSHDGPNDQWIELKNISSNDLHLKNWRLTYKSNAGNELKLVIIDNNRIVKSGEYFLLSYYTKNNSAINVQPDEDMDKVFGYEKFQLKLYASSTPPVLIDTGGNGTIEPTKGDKTNFYSMERNDTPSDGTNYDNWHTCLNASSTTMYWDSGRAERGTPGAANLSENDPSYTTLDTTPTSSPSPNVVSDPEINNIQDENDAAIIDENIIPDEIAATDGPPVENLPEQNPILENPLPDASVSEPEAISPDQPTESQEAIEPTPITIEPVDNQNNNSDPGENN